MKSEDKLYKIFWYALFIFLTISVLSISHCSMTNTASEMNTIKARHDAVAKMVLEGTDPKAAGCAIAITNPGMSAETKLYCNK